MGSKWTKAEKQFLKESLAKERLSLENIVVPGRSSERVRRQALKMGLIPKLRNPRISRSQRKKIREMRSQGYSVKQIAEFGLQEHPHRTANAVQKVLGRLRLVNKNRSRAARKRKIWRNGEKEEFYIFLRQYSATLSPQQIAKKFGVKKGTVTNSQRLLGIKTSLVQTLALPHIKRKMKKVYMEKSKKMLMAFENNLAEREKKLVELTEKIREQTHTAPREERCCKKCGRVWPKHKRFFFFRTVKISFGSMWCIPHVCVICVAKQRHRKKVEKYQKKYSQQLE